MNMKQKRNRFRAIQSGANGGFTLVELIVVIAILAILASVSVPAYSGYIEKANKAGDLQLLSAVNTAFAAAVLEHGDNIDTIDSATLTYGGSEGAVTVTGVSAPAKYNDAFNNYYGNSGSFKVMTRLVFDAEKHLFVDPATATSVTIGYGGAQVTITSEQIQLLKDSSYYGDDMTSEKLLKQVDSVALIASGMGPIEDIMNGKEFTAFATAALGLEEGADLNSEAHRLALKKLGWTEEDYNEKAGSDEFTDYQNAVKQVLGNALVLYTAQQTTNMGDSAMDLLGDGDNLVTSTQISDNMGKDKTPEQQQTAMNQAALVYGMYYAYVNSNACTDKNIKGDSEIDPIEVTTALDSNTEFQEYMTSAQGKQDMQAYLEALSVVNSGAQSSSAVENLLTNGFVDLNDLLTDTMGK